ncbi:MAG: sugar phosphate isomerase/epimerase [Propionibacteriaceae bacterium]|jgi:sugar phosphate isomerase/epimerase|nr:sugar phosphate isomerase/epimerase [Propionibacteriaceae bacterium]
MKISAFPKGDLDDIVNGKITVFQWIAQAATLPIEGVELYSRMLLDKGESFWDQVADCLDEHDLVMPMLCASPDLSAPDPAVRQREFDREVQMIQAARRISGPGVSVRVLSGQRRPEVGVEQGLEWVADAINRLVDVASELGVLLGIENHYKDGFWKYPEFAQRPEVFFDLLDRIDERVWFGVQYDPSNAITAGADSADFLDKVIDRVYTIQASDRSLAPGGNLADLKQADGTLGYSPLLKHGIIGQGLNDYDRIFSTLWNAGYDGWISVEDGVNSFDELRASCEFLVQARHRWFAGSTKVSVATLDHARARQGLPPFEWVGA